MGIKKATLEAEAGRPDTASRIALSEGRYSRGRGRTGRLRKVPRTDPAGTGLDLGHVHGDGLVTQGLSTGNRPTSRRWQPSYV